MTNNMAGAGRGARRPVFAYPDIMPDTGMPEFGSSLPHEMSVSEKAHLIFGHPVSFHLLDMPGAFHTASDCANAFISPFDTTRLEALMDQRSSAVAHPEFADEAGDTRVGDIMIGPRLLRTLNAMGIDARAIGVVALFMGYKDFEMTADGTEIEFGLFHDEHPDRPGTIQRSIMATFTLAKGVTWDAACDVIRIEGDMPDTLVAAMAKRPLGDVVSHPLLDRLGYVIDNAQRDGEVTILDCVDRTGGEPWVTLDSMNLWKRS